MKLTSEKTHWEWTLCIACLYDNNYKTFSHNEYNACCGNNFIVLSFFMENLFPMFWHVIFLCTSHVSSCNVFHKLQISELSSWWDNDLTHHISLYQPLCEPLFDKNQPWWCVALIVWSWYLPCAIWNLSAV